MNLLFLQNLSIAELIIIVLMLFIPVILLVLVVFLCIRMSRPKCLRCGSRKGYRLEYYNGVTMKRCKNCNNV
jgi:hypothetical protein